MFPNLSKLAAIGLLLPMSTVDCERGFSTLSRFKTDLRNCLSNRILNHLHSLRFQWRDLSLLTFRTILLVIFGGKCGIGGSK